MQHEAKELSFTDYVKSHPNLKACWVTSNYQQAREDILMAKSVLEKEIEQLDFGRMKIFLKNGTEIVFATIKVPERLRGRQIDYLGCSRLVDNAAYNALIRPCLFGVQNSIAIKASGVNAKPLEALYER
jgi:hypothetical protein